MTASEGEGDESSFVFVSAKSKQPSPKSAKRQGSKTQYTTGKEREAKDERKDSSGEVASTTKLWLQFTLHEVCASHLIPHTPAEVNVCDYRKPHSQAGSKCFLSWVWNICELGPVTLC